MMHSLNHYSVRVTQSHWCYYCTYLQESLLHAVGGSDHGNWGSERVGVWKMDSLGDGSAFTKTQRSREQLKLLLTRQMLCIIYFQHVPVFCRAKRVFNFIWLLVIVLLAALCFRFPCMFCMWTLLIPSYTLSCFPNRSGAWPLYLKNRDQWKT